MKTFREFFLKAPCCRASASGRVNLIGEHTDYNGGYVLPTGIPQRTHVELALADDPTSRRCRILSANILKEKNLVEFDLGSEKATGHWGDYVQGITWLLAQEHQLIYGFEARVESTVPIGSGLSSSAALEVSFLRALRQAFDLRFDDVTLARLGQRVENEFVGARVGIMDQMAASLASQGEALFLDTLDLSFERIPLPLHLMDLVVIGSGISHKLAGGEYNRRREECEEACRLLGVALLRHLTIDDLPSAQKKLPSLLFKRVKHVVSENSRVLQAVSALRQERLEALGLLLNESHRSLQEDYEVSLSEMDGLVQIAQSQPEVFGARMTGGGFGGSILALTKKGEGPRVSQVIARLYRERFQKTPAILVTESEENGRKESLHQGSRDPLETSKSL